MCIPDSHTDQTDSPEIIILFPCSTQILSMKFIMLINVKMPRMVGILTFISMINTVFMNQHFSFF